MSRKPNFKNIFIIIAYIVLSYLVMLYCLSHPNIIISFLISLSFGLISTAIFLHLFIHQSSSDFVKKLEQVEKKSETKYLKKFLRFGKFIACVIISLVGGPIFLALTVKLLFAKTSHKYRIAFIACILSNFIFIFFSKSLLNLIF